MIHFVLADLRRLWAGSIVVVLLVALATALGAGVTLTERALRLGSARAAESFDLVVGAAGSETQLVLSSVFLQAAPLPLMSGAALKKIATDPRVAWAAPVGFGDFAEGRPIVGTTPEMITGAGRRPLAEGHIFAALNEAVVGAHSGLAIGDIIRPMHGQAEEGGHVHEGIRYTVTGRMAETGTPWDRAVLVPIEAVWRIHGLGHHDEDVDHDEDHDHDAGSAGATADHDDHDHDQHDEAHDLAGPVSPSLAAMQALPPVPAVIVKPKTFADAYRLRAEYRKGDTLAVFPAEVLTRLYGTLGDARTVLSAVAGGAQALVAAAIALVTIVHVSQRRRQIGALRAFGAPRLAVFGIVWLEIFALVGLGVAAGLALGLVAASVFARLFTQQSGIVLPVAYGAGDAGFVALLLAGAAILAAIPALMAYRQPAAAALRG